MTQDNTSRPILATAGSMPITMSTREIADLVEARHNDVIETVERLFAKEVLRESRKTLRPYSPPGGGRPTNVYDLTKRDTLVVVAGYDDALRARIIDRWIELEAERPAQPAINPADPRTMLAVFTHLQEQVDSLSVQVAELKPAAAALERIAESHGTFCRSTAAKNLQIPPHTLIRWMRTNGWTFRRPGDKDDLAYQSKIAGGLLEHKVTTGQRPDGSEWSSTQVRVTPKGMTALGKAFPPPLQAA
ncbi:phage antirepressor KilAC domain-containing protein [Methylobacterium dankookense]|uniref:Antirepressor protein C-terminal domain-containing protein n=1 Tax=Methylobacterium dankookense TaxID=560405 RepID=A0A564G6I1_9HYPH|nr:phage regulatory protein/antirepressor Ant [Methylobacterium dankookense]GJD58351.1 hypothetical protein IFDJLNFL_4270 [Methylobacterium dankookense]VUF15644.1 hypothetical protein MTDSW087_05388 [Methylobacterium dankookense]